MKNVCNVSIPILGVLPWTPKHPAGWFKKRFYSLFILSMKCYIFVFNYPWYFHWNEICCLWKTKATCKNMRILHFVPWICFYLYTKLFCRFMHFNYVALLCSSMWLHKLLPKNSDLSYKLNTEILDGSKNWNKNNTFHCLHTLFSPKIEKHENKMKMFIFCYYSC